MSTQSTSPLLKTQEEQQLAQQLGFRPPVAPAPILAPKKGATTQVVGYFNGNPWPVHISISALGISIHLDQRGEYVTSNGQKVNDPILDQYAGPGQLSRELSKTPVPVIRIIPVSVSAPNQQHSVHGTQTLDKNKEGIVIKPIMTPVVDPTASVPLPSSAPVVGMTMEAARRMRLVRQTVDPGESNVVDTFGNPADSKSIPTIDDVMPRDITPGEQRRLNREAQTAHPALSAPESDAQAVLQQALRKAGKNNVIVDDAVKAALMASAPEVDPTANLPRPNLTESADKFVCSLDGEEFDFRSELEKHAKSKFPDSVEEIMAPYPAAP